VQLLRTLARGGVAPVVRRTIPIAAPAADTGITFAPDNGRTWQVLSIAIPFTTSSHSANRSLLLSLSDGQNTLWTIPTTAVQAASLTVTNTWIQDYYPVQSAAIGGALPMGLPPTILVPGWSLTVGLVNGDTADQVGVGYAQVLETFTGETEAEYNTARAIAHHAGAIAELVAGEVPGL